MLIHDHPLLVNVAEANSLLFIGFEYLCGSARNGYHRLC